MGQRGIHACQAIVVEERTQPVGHTHPHTPHQIVPVDGYVPPPKEHVEQPQKTGCQDCAECYQRRRIYTGLVGQLAENGSQAGKEGREQSGNDASQAAISFGVHRF